MILHDENHTEISARRNDRPVPGRGGSFTVIVLLQRFSAARGPGDREGVPTPLVGRLLPPSSPRSSRSPFRLPAPRGPARPGAARRGLGDDGALRRRGGDARGRPPRAGRQRRHLRRGAAHRWQGVPWGTARRSALARIVSERAGAGASEHVFREITPEVWCIPTGSPRTGSGCPASSSPSVRRRRSASRVRARGGLRARRRRRVVGLELSDGTIHGEPTGKLYRVASFGRMTFRIPLEASSISGGRPERDDPPRTVTEGGRDRGQRGGTPPIGTISTAGSPSPYPASPFGLLAIPLGFSLRSRGKSSAVGITVALVLVYYLFIAAAGAVERTLRSRDDRPPLGAQRPRALPCLVDPLAVGRSLTLLPASSARIGSANDRPLALPVPGVPRAAAVCILGFLLLFLLIDFVDHAEKLLRHNAGLREIGWYYLTRVPGIFVLISRVGTMLAVLVAVSLRVRSNELTAIFSGGVSLLRVCVPILVGCALVSALSRLLSEVLARPRTGTPGRSSASACGRERWRRSSRGNRYWMRGERGILSAQVVGRPVPVAAGFQYIEVDPDFRPLRRIESRRARLLSDGAGLRKEGSGSSEKRRRWRRFPSGRTGSRKRWTGSSRGNPPRR